MNKDLVCTNEITCSNMLKQKIKMFNFDYITKDIKEYNPNWPQGPNHPYRILIAGCTGLGKTNALLNLINHEPDTDKIYLYEKDAYDAKYQLLINKRESTGLKYLK